MAISLTCTSLAYNDFRGRDLVTVSNYEKFDALGTCVQFVTEKQLEHADAADSWYSKDCDKQLWRGTLEVSVHGLYWANRTMGKGATNADLARVRQCHHLPSPSPPLPVSRATRCLTTCRYWPATGHQQHRGRNARQSVHRQADLQDGGV
jgi:hypothetical protein